MFGCLVRPPARALVACCEALIRLARRGLGAVPGGAWTTASAGRRLSRNRELAGRHSGERCLILGNGPSLSAEDLSLLADEVVFSCNQGYQLLGRHDLVPRYHAVVDPVQLEAEYRGLLDDLVALQQRGCTILASSELAAALRLRSASGALYETHQFLITDYVERPDSPLPDLTQSQFGYLSVIHMVIHFALYMGFKRIILLGCDMDFFIDPAKPFTHGYGEPHYGPSGVSTAELFGWDQLGLMEWCLREFRAFAELGRMANARGASIVNAGRGGALNVFPRATLREALGLDG